MGPLQNLNCTVQREPATTAQAQRRPADPLVVLTSPTRTGKMLSATAALNAEAARDRNKDAEHKRLEEKRRKNRENMQKQQQTKVIPNFDDDEETEEEAALRKFIASEETEVDKAMKKEQAEQRKMLLAMVSSMSSQVDTLRDFNKQIVSPRHAPPAPPPRALRRGGRRQVTRDRTGPSPARPVPRFARGAVCTDCGTDGGEHPPAEAQVQHVHARGVPLRRRLPLQSSRGLVCRRRAQRRWALRPDEAARHTHAPAHRSPRSPPRTAAPPTHRRAQAGPTPTRSTTPSSL